jgi:transposase
MPVCVGIDVHRKRSQVAVIDQDGGVLASRNVPMGGMIQAPAQEPR